MQNIGHLLCIKKCAYIDAKNDSQFIASQKYLYNSLCLFSVHWIKIVSINVTKLLLFYSDLYFLMILQIVLEEKNPSNHVYFTFT